MAADNGGISGTDAADAERRASHSQAEPLTVVGGRASVHHTPAGFPLVGLQLDAAKKQSVAVQLRAQAAAAALLCRDLPAPPTVLSQACGGHDRQLQETYLRSLAPEPRALQSARPPLQGDGRQHRSTGGDQPTEGVAAGSGSGRTAAAAAAAAAFEVQGGDHGGAPGVEGRGAEQEASGEDVAAFGAAAQLAKRDARRAVCEADLEVAMETLPEDSGSKLQALLDLRALRLSGLQRSLRQAVACERRALTDCRSDSLLEWSRLRRRLPGEPGGPPPPPPQQQRTPQSAGSAAQPMGTNAFAAGGLRFHSHQQLRRPGLDPPVEPWPLAETLGASAAVLAAAQAGREAELQEARRKQAEERAVAARVRDIQNLIQVERQVRESRSQLLEEQQLRQREVEYRQRILQERRDFLSDAATWQREGFRAAAQAAQRRRVLRSQGIRAWHSREARRAQREEGLRIAALRSHNYEEYLRLAQRTKDKRLRTLLEKTDKILVELGVKVQEQRVAIVSAGVDAAGGGGNGGDDDAGGHGAAELLGGGSRLADGDEDEDLEERLITGHQNYYNMVHNVEEKVMQPAMLQGGLLRSYQLGGLRFLLSLYNNNMNGILADEMGLGKTIQTISFLAYLLETKGNKGPHIVLAPKAVLPNWQREFAKWAPTFKLVLYDGAPEDRKAMQRDVLEQGTFNVLATHYDLIMRDKTALRKFNWEMLIVDEGHRLKNSESKLADILRSYSFKHRVLLTGTPIQNSLTELWALLNFVLPKVFNSVDTFDDWFAAPFKGALAVGEDTKQQLSEEEQLLVINRLHQVIRPFMLRRTKREVEKELPSKTEHVVKCKMSAWQKVLYNQIAESGRVNREGAGAVVLRNSAMHLRKACNHPYLFLQDTAYDPADPEELVRASGKIALLDNVLPKLKSTGHRVLLFSQMTMALDVIEDYLLMRGYKYLRLDGRTNTEDRGRMLEEFNADGSDVFVFILSTRAGGLGLNLQTADTVIMFDSDWNPQADLQAEDRAHRIGQKKNVLVLVLASGGTIEEAILDKAQQKREIDAKVIQAGMFNDKSTHEERQQVLRQILEKGGLADKADTVHNDQEINQMLARSPEEYILFEAVDEQDRKQGESMPGGARSKLLTMEEVPKWVFPEEVLSSAGDSSSEEEQEGDDIRRRSRRGRRKAAAAAAAGGSGATTTYDERLGDQLFDQMLQDAEDTSGDEAAGDTGSKQQRRRTSGGRGGRGSRAGKAGGAGAESASNRRSSGRGGGSGTLGRAAVVAAAAAVAVASAVAAAGDGDEEGEEDDTAGAYGVRLGQRRAAVGRKRARVVVDDAVDDSDDGPGGSGGAEDGGKTTTPASIGGSDDVSGQQRGASPAKPDGARGRDEEADAKEGGGVSDGVSDDVSDGDTAAAAVAAAATPSASSLGRATAGGRGGRGRGGRGRGRGRAGRGRGAGRAARGGRGAGQGASREDPEQQQQQQGVADGASSSSSGDTDSGTGGSMSSGDVPAARRRGGGFGIRRAAGRAAAAVAAAAGGSRGSGAGRRGATSASGVGRGRGRKVVASRRRAAAAAAEMGGASSEERGGEQQDGGNGGKEQEEEEEEGGRRGQQRGSGEVGPSGTPSPPPQSFSSSGEGEDGDNGDRNGKSAGARISAKRSVATARRQGTGRKRKSTAIGEPAAADGSADGVARRGRKRQVDDTGAAAVSATAAQPSKGASGSGNQPRRSGRSSQATTVVGDGEEGGESEMEAMSP